MNSDVDASLQTKPRSSLIKILSSETFLEKVALLVLTAILSGAVIPLIIKSIDTRREGREAVFRAQAKLYDDISEIVLTYETLALDVSWYGTPAAKNVALQRKAFERYSERVVDLIARWRTQVSRAQTLASPAIGKKIRDFLNDETFPQDTKLNQMWNRCGIDCDWAAQHQENVKKLGNAYALISEIAEDLGLSQSALSK